MHDLIKGGRIYTYVHTDELLTNAKRGIMERKISYFYFLNNFNVQK